MKLNDYQSGALRTAPQGHDTNREMLHAVLGLVTEAGELADALKKQLAYGKPVDRVNLIEEAGDVLWYLPLLARALGTDLETIGRINLEKLRKRYPDKFSEDLANHRTLEVERETLERLSTPSAHRNISLLDHGDES